MRQLEIHTIRSRAAPPLRPGQSTFEYYFEPLFPELRPCWFVVDQWRPEDLHPAQRDLLGRYRVASLDAGRRAIDVYRGKRFLATFGFAIPSSYGDVFAFAAEPDEATIRASTWDGCQINKGKLAEVAVASFSAFEGAWSVGTLRRR
jgi:hypothetical protein